MIRTMFKSILCFLGVTLLFLYGLLCTEVGLKGSYFIVRSFLPGELSVSTLQGTWLSPITVEKLHYHHGAWRIDTEQMTFQWNLVDLLHGQFTINELAIESLSLHQLSTEQDNAIHNMSLPFPLNIRQTEIAFFTYRPANFAEPIQLMNVHTTLNLLPHYFSFMANWQNASLPIKDKMITSEWGNIRVQGNRENYSLTGRLETSAPELPPIEWQLHGNGNSHHLSAINLDGLVLGGRLSLTGQVDWLDGLSVSGTFEGKNLQPNKGDNLHVNGNFHGIKNATQTKIALNLHQLSGRLNHDTISGKGGFLWQNNHFLFDKINVQLGQSQLFIDGFIDDEWQLQWNIDIPAFKTYFPIKTAALKSQGSVRGLREKPQIEADFSAKEFQYDNVQSKNIEGLIHIDLANKKRSFIHLTANNSWINQIPLQQIAIDAKGDDLKQQIHAVLETQNELLNINLEGQFQQNQWNGHISQLTLDSSKLGTWNLIGKSPLTLTKETIQLSPLCIQSKQGKLCGQFKWSPKQALTVAVNGEQINASLASVYFNDKATLDSAISFNLDIDHQVKATLAKLDLRVNKGSFRFNSGSQLHQYDVNGALFHAVLNEDGLQGLMKVNVNNRTPIAMDFTLPLFHQKYFSSDQPITSLIQLNLQDVSLLGLLFPHINNIKGHLTSAIKIKGSLKNPQIDSEALLTEGSFTIPNLGLKVNEVSITAKNSGYKTINYLATATSGPGKLSMKGETALNQPGFPTQLLITGKDVEITNTPEINILATPDIQIYNKGTQFSITGKILVPKALIKPQDFSSTITLSDDVIFVNAGKVDDEAQFNVNSNVDVMLGDNVLFDFSGLTGNLKGNVKLKDSSEQGTVAFGQFSIEKGKLNKYNQELSISNGQLLFTGGAIDNPGINLKAIKRIVSYQKASAGKSGPNFGVSQYNVGIQIMGNINEPRVTLFSEPAGLSQSEILSYLVLSSPLSQTEGGENQLLFQALQGLNLTTGQTSMIKEQLQQTLRLDQLSVSSSEVYNAETESMVHNTSIILGKMLSPKLLLSYSIGLIEPVNILKLSYKLSDKLTLQSEASTESSGIDIFYSIERD